MSNCGYMGEAFNPSGRPELLRRLARRLESARKNGLEFDSIAFRGVSGAMIGPSLADLLGLGLIAVRKPNDGSHSSADAEASYGAKRYVIVDDLISSGRTIRAAMERAGEYGNRECVGILLYAQNAEYSYDCCPNDLKHLVMNDWTKMGHLDFYHEVAIELEARERAEALCRG